MVIQESGEMYLETILILSEKLENVRSLDVAEYMNYSKPSVSRAMGILKDRGFIQVDSKGYITLLEKGKELAEKIYDRHQALTTVLEAIGVDPQIAEQDACKIEHDISDETFNAIQKHASKYRNKKDS